MKNNRTIVNTRRQKILTELQTNKTIRVDDLAEKLQVSPLTIRRDLDYFSEKNLVERFYGGASLSQKVLDASSLVAKDTANFALHKHAIAQKAASMVEDGDTIFINTSSTALLMIKYLANKHVNIITNNGKAILMDKDPFVSIVLTGGELRIPKESMTGDFAINNLSRVTAVKCFMGVSGITPTTGITSAILPEVAINEMMIKRTVGKKYILADQSKIGKDSTFVCGTIEQLNVLITDSEANPDVLHELQAMNMQIMLVEPLKQIE